MTTAATKSSPTAVETKWFSGTHTKDGLRDLLSGMIAGFVCKIFEYPMDTIKVLQQTQPDITSSWDAVVKVQKHRGLMSLYQGLASPLVGSMLECSVLFVTFGYIKKMLRAEDDSLSSTVPAWKVWSSGGLSGMFSAGVLTPFELIKCRLQIQQQGAKQYSGPVDCLMKTVQQEGLQGLWRGNLSCLAREMPGNAAWFGAYDFLMRRVQAKYTIEKREDVPLMYSAMSGSVAGVMYWLIPYPADTVKSKIQTDSRFADKSIPQAVRMILQEEGVTGMYRGCGITCARAAPSHALIFYCYATASNMLLKY